MTTGMPPSRRGWYLFGVLPPDSDIQADDWPCFDGSQRVHLVRAANLFAVVARIGMSGLEAGAPGIDPERLTELIRDHDRVLREVAACGRALVPVPFGTVAETLDELRRRIEARCQDLYDAVSRLEGCDEWGVHVTVPREAAQVAVRRMTREIYDRLAACSENAVIEPIAAGAQEERPSALSAAFLVNRDRLERFRAVAEELQERWAMVGSRVSTSGPWPAYHFARVDLGAASSDSALVLLGPLSAPERAWST